MTPNHRRRTNIPTSPSAFLITVLLSICVLLLHSAKAGDLAVEESLLSEEQAENAIVIPKMMAGERDLTYPILYVGTKQVVGLAFLSALDKDVTMFDSFSVETFRDGWRRGPEWDDDEWAWNYIGHPLWGSETFLRARAQHFNFAESFAFSTAASVVWEFGMGFAHGFV